MAAHVSQYKKQVVQNLSRLILEYPITAVVNLENLPAKQLQKIRASMRSDVTIVMSKRSLIQHSFDASKKPGIDSLKASLGGMPALLFTRKNPFKLANMLAKSRTPAPAKPGQVAPRDIIIPAGATPFSPGPIISELAGVGIKAGIEGGKVAIKQDFLAARQGERIKPKVAELLTKLNILPMEAGLDLVAVYEDGVIYERNVLSVSEEAYLGMVASAARQAVALATGVGYFTPETLRPLIAKAFNEAKGLALGRNIITDETIKQMLAVADAHGTGVFKKSGLPEQKRPSKEELEFADVQRQMKEKEAIAEKLDEAKEEAKKKEEIAKAEANYNQMMRKGTLRK